MKTTTFIISSLAGAGLYLLYKNREDIKASYLESKKHLNKARYDLDNIKHHLARINEEKERLVTLSQDLSYKFRVFQSESQSHLAQIERTMAKYRSEK